jgi:transcriptional regulator with XRE-family HTH domain
MVKRTARGNLGFGGKLRVLRGARGVTQTGLAQRSGGKRSAISEYESGKAQPDVATIERLLRGMRFKWSAIDHATAFLRSLESGDIETEAAPAGEAVSLGAIIRVLRHARGLSQIGLAKKAGVGRSAIAECEEDRAAPTPRPSSGFLRRSG